MTVQKIYDPQEMTNLITLHFLGISGTVWACYFMTAQIKLWYENPYIITKSNVNLSSLKYPAITICPEGIFEPVIKDY